MVDRHLGTARSAADRFSARLHAADYFSEDLAYEYKVAKEALASSFQKVALAALDREGYPLDDIKSALSETMQTLFEGRVDSSLLKVRGYTTPHPLVYALLAENVGHPVPSWRLRLLTADAIHTERRTRELRDLGLNVQTSGPQDSLDYTLVSTSPNWTYGAAYQLRKNARDSSTLDPAEKDHVIALAELTAVLPKARGAS